MGDPYPDTCVHQEKGLCPECQADHDEDPGAWAEWGAHPAGLENWRKMQEELDARPRGEEVPADDEIPFRPAAPRRLPLGE